jgi:uncharacterized membrane protein YsdA (DUF1294 family)
MFVVYFYLVMSAICFCAYGFDKRAAIAGKQRISERTLWLLGLFCGWPGALLAQQFLRHKSSKASFRLVFFITVICNLVVVGFIWSMLNDTRVLHR